jgi:hypothetical protein
VAACRHGENGFEHALRSRDAVLLDRDVVFGAKLFAQLLPFAGWCVPPQCDGEQRDQQDADQDRRGDY